MTERSLFLAALEIDDPAQRSAHLDRACNGDPALWAQLERLLQARPTTDGRRLWAPAWQFDAGFLWSESD